MDSWVDYGFKSVKAALCLWQKERKKKIILCIQYIKNEENGRNLGNLPGTKEQKEIEWKKEKHQKERFKYREEGTENQTRKENRQYVLKKKSLKIF
jgi:hypothetical protein